MQLKQGNKRQSKRQSKRQQEQKQGNKSLRESLRSFPGVVPLVLCALQVSNPFTRGTSNCAGEPYGKYLPQNLVGGDTAVVNGFNLLRVDDKELEDAGRVQRALAVTQFNIVPTWVQPKVLS